VSAKLGRRRFGSASVGEANDDKVEREVAGASRQHGVDIDRDLASAGEPVLCCVVSRAMTARPENLSIIMARGKFIILIIRCIYLVPSV
jgi:hypothetical protein